MKNCINYIKNGEKRIISQIMTFFAIESHDLTFFERLCFTATF